MRCISRCSSNGTIVFQGYTDHTFSIKTASTLAATGRLGPLIYAESLDTVKVVFYNRADRDLSLHPHALRVGKGFEGVFYDDEFSGIGTMAFSVCFIQTNRRVILTSILKTNKLLTILLETETFANRCS